MPRRLIAALVISLFTLSCLAACSGDDDATAPTPDEVYRSGPGAIYFDRYADFDAGTFGIVSGTPEMDLYWGDEPQGWQAQGSAGLYALGVTSFDGVTRDQVAALTMGTLVSDLGVNKVVAYKTGDGRYGKLIMTAFDAMSGIYTITFVTWS